MTYQQSLHGPASKMSETEEVNARPEARQTQIITLHTPFTLETGRVGDGNYNLLPLSHTEQRKCKGIFR